MGRGSGGVALVTGGGHGMGRKHVHGLARAGFRVIAVDIDQEAVAAVAAEVTDAGNEAIGLAADVTEEVAVAASIAAAREHYGRLDVLVNNAGGSLTDLSLAELTLAQWEATLRLNLTSQFLCIRAVLPTMISQGSGRIINIATASVFNGATAAVYRDDGRSNLVAYLAAKGGVVSMTRALAREAGRWNITVNAVAPGFVPTVRVRQAFPEHALDLVVANQALPQLIEPGDVTGAVVFLATPAAALITGQVICVDGGWTMG